MAKAWEKLDLEGGGLQSANLALKRALKKPVVAYALWLGLMPLAAHSLYLRAPGRAAAIWALDAAVVVCFLFNQPQFALGLLAILALVLLWDLRWIDRRIVAVNKSIRMALYLRPGAGAPKNFRGRYRDDDNEIAQYTADKERERAGHQPTTSATAPPKKRAPSFAEQEAMLRELAKKRPNDG